MKKKQRLSDGVFVVLELISIWVGILFGLLFSFEFFKVMPGLVTGIVLFLTSYGAIHFLVSVLYPEVKDAEPSR